MYLNTLSQTGQPPPVMKKTVQSCKRHAQSNNARTSEGSYGEADAARRPTPRTVQSAAGLDRAPRPRRIDDGMDASSSISA